MWLLDRRYQHTSEWITRTKEKDTLVVRMEDFKVDCTSVRTRRSRLQAHELTFWILSLPCQPCWSTQALGRALDWLGVARREDRIECACGRDHRAKRASNFSHAFTPKMLQEAQKTAGPLMARLGYDIEQSRMAAVPEFGLPALSFPSGRRQQREAFLRPTDSDLGALLRDDSHEYDFLGLCQFGMCRVCHALVCRAAVHSFVCGARVCSSRQNLLFRDYSGFAGFAGRPGELEWWAGD